VSGRPPRPGPRPRRLAFRIAVGCCVVTLFAPIAARADDPPVVISAADQLEAYYDRALEESVLDNRLDVTLGRGAYTLGASFLSHSPSDAGRLDPNDFGAQTQGIRKRWLEAATDDWTVRVGDVYSTYGRGLALSIFEDQTVDFDNVLDGVMARGALGPAELRVIAGTNSIGDEFQVLKGARLDLRGDRWGRFGLQGVWSDSTSVGGIGRPGGDRLYGSSWERSVSDFADVYGEYVIRHPENYRAGARQGPDGHGGYGSLALYLGRVQVLAEYKDLLRYQLPFVNPPTTVRQHTTTLMNRGGHTPNIRLDDERGGLIEAQFQLAEATRVVSSYSKTEARQSNQPSWEVYGELEQDVGESLELFLKGGETEETVLEGENPVFFERRNAVAQAIWRVDDTWSIEGTFETQAVQESNRGTAQFRFPLEFSNHLISTTVSRAPNLSLALTTEWTDDDRPEDDLWVWGECNLRLGDRRQLLLGGGRLRGGQLCSGGVCKLVDPFEGGRIEFLTTF